MNTHTISSPVSLSGRGLHTGKNVTVTFNPAPEHTGILFRRVDLPGQPMVHAIATNVFDTSRGTSIKENNAEVRTVEHLMAALAGLQIDNVIVDIDAEETPILDGSARYYVEALQKAGIVEQQQERVFRGDETLQFLLAGKTDRDPCGAIRRFRNQGGCGLWHRGVGHPNG